jgi:hypothetical protein
VLVYAYRADAVDHRRFRDWLIETIVSDASYGVSELVLSGFVRIVTHPRVFVDPSPVDAALTFASGVREQPNAVIVAPGVRHWTIFDGLCRGAGARGKLIPDAYFAALAIESGSEWITTDRDYARFPGLRWRHPLAA